MSKHDKKRTEVKENNPQPAQEIFNDFFKKLYTGKNDFIQQSIDNHISLIIKNTKEKIDVVLISEIDSDYQSFIIDFYADGECRFTIIFERQKPGVNKLVIEQH